MKRNHTVPKVTNNKTRPRLNGCRRRCRVIISLVAVLTTALIALGSLAVRNAYAVTGTFTVGPTGTYASLTAAIVSINGGGGATGPIVLELQPTYLSGVETFPINPKITGASASNTITIRPETGATGLSITSSAAQTFNFDGASFVAIDGRPGGAGSSKELTIDNTSLGGNSIRFVNDSGNNTIEYSIVKGVNNSTAGGTIFFGDTTNPSGPGNDNNTIDHCDIRDGATTPAIAVHSFGTFLQENSFNTISNCNIFNFYNASGDSTGIFLEFASTDWTITGNSLYQESARASASFVVKGIRIVDTTGGNFTVSNNFIGGSAAGTAGTWTTTGSANYRFVGIQMNVAGTTASSVQNNIIRGFAWSAGSNASTPGTTSGGTAGVWCGIYIQGGLVNVGTITGNTIGSGVGTSSISITNSTNGSITYGIATQSSSTSGSVFSNNTIGSITTNGTSGSIAASFKGIHIQQASTTISGNLIGSLSTANSLNASNPTTGFTSQSVIGIDGPQTGSSNNSTITGNTVANLNNNDGSSATTALVRGIRTQVGVNTITGNTVRNLSSTSNNNGTNNSAAVVGISQQGANTSGSQGQTVAQNTVHSLSSNPSVSTSAVYLYGIYFLGGGTLPATNVVAGNLVHSLNVATDSSQMVGILANAQTGTSNNTNYQNNMIRLGIDAAGNSQTTASIISGILDAGGSVGNFYFNSVYIGGTGVGTSTPAHDTFAFNSENTSNTAREVKDNIFYNARSNGPGTGKHYAISIYGSGIPSGSTTTGLSSNNNIFYVNGTGGVMGRYVDVPALLNPYDFAALSAWQSKISGTGQDGNSYFADPLYVAPSAATPDLHVQPGTPAEGVGIAIAGITDDFDGDTRASFTPTDIGADAGNFTVADTTPPFVVSINRADANPTNAAAVNFTVVFSESVTGVDATDFALAASGVTGATIGTVTGGGTTYNVPVNTGTGDGTLGLNLVDNDSIVDGAANPLGGVGASNGNFTGQVYTIDKTGPTVTINQAGAQADPTNASPINFTVVFSESVSDFATGDVTLSGTAGATTATVTGSGTTYNVAVSGMTGDGTVIANIAAGVATDGVGNSNSASTSTDNTVTYDATAPTVIIDQAGAQADPTNASPINFTVVFSESVSDFATGDVMLSGTAGATTATVTGSGATYNVVVSGMTGDGTVIANIAAGVASDAAGNSNAASTSTDNTVTYDATAPTVTIDQAGTQADPTNASPINFTVVFSESVSDFATGDVTLSGTAGATTATVTGSGTTYNVAVSGMTGDGTVIANIAAGVATDAAGNSNAASTSTDNAVTYDNTVPTVVSINRADTDPTNAATVNFTVTFSESVTGVDAGDFALATSGVSGASMGTVTGSGNTYNVPIGTGTGDGALGLNLVDNDSILDVVGNPLGGSGADNGNFTGQVYTIDKTGPIVTINQAGAQADPTNGSPINFTVVFSESVSDFATGDVTLSGTAGATTATVTGSGTTYNVAVSGMTGDGTVIANIAAGVATDGVGNSNSASTSTDNTVTFDTTVPVSISANDARAAEPPSGTSQMWFTITLSAPAPGGGVSVNYATANDSSGANPGTGGALCGGAVDYETTSGTLNFASGERLKAVPVNICADGVSEPTETLLLNLSSASAPATITDAQAVGEITQTSVAGALLISEVRAFGPGPSNDPNDDFVEVYNNTDSQITVPTGGYGLFEMGADCNATPVLMGTIPAASVIPARGHFLFTGSAYSLTNYGGTGAATGDAVLATELGQNRNLALFSTTDVGALSTANRLDAVGFGSNTGNVCDLLRESPNQPSLTTNLSLLGQHSYFRQICAFQAGCPTPGRPRDTNDNASDFIFADTNGTSTSAGQRLGTPGPENLTSPIKRDPQVDVVILDASVAQSSPPNRARDLTSDPGNVSTSGTMTIRRRIVNQTGGSVTRLRFRIIDMTTFPQPAGIADLRARTSSSQSVMVNDTNTCAVEMFSAPCTLTVNGTTLEQPPTQPAGGGLNSTISISLSTPLANGSSVNVQFLLGVQQTGSFRFYIIVEALP